ncbi:hypothetical protein [Streptomyces sp. KL116D]|uniref:hypothetical protein n=1 Tax=Streptomyces sp. KL116D TaxID=3045152 RepID=UPI003557357A
MLLETSGGCTQPSWRTVVRAESWLDDILSTTRPHTVLLSSDTSPLGVLAAHAAERHGANSVHVQHGGVDGGIGRLAGPAQPRHHRHAASEDLALGRGGRAIPRPRCTYSGSPASTSSPV